MIRKKTGGIIIADKTKDNRVKLTDEDKRMIPIWHKENNASVAEIAKKLKVSRTAIYYVLDPEKEARAKQLRIERGGEMQYYNKRKRKKYQAKHNQRKKELMQEQIKENIFTLCRVLVEGQLVNKLSLKNDTYINNGVIVENDTDKKILELVDGENKSFTVQYEQVKNLIFKTK